MFGLSWNSGLENVNPVVEQLIFFKSTVSRFGQMVRCCHCTNRGNGNQLLCSHQTSVTHVSKAVQNLHQSVKTAKHVSGIYKQNISLISKKCVFDRMIVHFSWFHSGVVYVMTLSKLN